MRHLLKFDQLIGTALAGGVSLVEVRDYRPIARRSLFCRGHLSQVEMIGAGWLDAGGSPVDPTFKTPEQGATTAVWVARSPRLASLGGLYCENCDVAVRAEPFVGVCAYTIDQYQAERLWRHSAKLVSAIDHPTKATAG